jgi:hypothetical protein
MYYPKSQITPNLYTNGGEFVYATTKEAYSGYYFKISTGKYFTGRNQDDRPNVELIVDTFGDTTQIDPQIDSAQENVTTSNYTTDIPYSVITVDYNNITQNKFQTTTAIPNYNPVLPTPQDYQNGEFRRLFAKKTNEIQYIEIDQDTFDKLLAKDPQILWQLYEPFDLTWYLTGNIEDVARINFNTVELTSKRKRLPRLGDYLKFDYIKYYNKMVTTNVLVNRDTRANSISSTEQPTGSFYRDNSIPR